MAEHLKYTLGEHDIEVILAEADHRVASTPSIYDLDAFLDKLTRHYRIDVWYTRHQLKWLVKKVYKEFGIEMKNPYWKPRHSKF